MLNEEKSIHVIEFLGKEADQESWSEKFLSHGKHKGYKKLLSSGSMSGMDTIPTQDKYGNALKGYMDLTKEIGRLGELNELAYKDLILSINTCFSVRTVAFWLMRNAKSAYFLEGIYKVAWEKLLIKYGQHTASFLLKLKSKFHNSKVEPIAKDPYKWIMNL